MDLKTALSKRFEELGLTLPGLSSRQNPAPDLLDREVANRYSATVRKVLTAPETCKPGTLRGVLEVLRGKLIIQIEFTETKTYNLNP